MAIRFSSISRVMPLVLGLALSAGSVLPAGAASGSLKPLVVQSSDVHSAFGSGFKLLALRKMTLADVRGVQSLTTKSGASGLLKGWVSGYFSSFYRTGVTKTGSGLAPKPGVSVVTSGVSLYSNSAYPRTAMDLTLKNKGTILKQLRKLGVSKVQIAPLPGVGDKAIVMQYSLVIPGIKKASTSALVIVFSRGHFTGTLSVSGSGSIPKTQVLALVHQVDSRLQHAG
jgi:hypothetical protein